jgi:glycosyltransferase involved in cell wall biosynthesis
LSPPLTLTVIVPALDEEAHIADTVDEIRAGVEGRFDDWEILLFDDGSTDRTGAIMDELAAGDPRLRVTHNPRPRNLGGVYKQGVAAARCGYLVMIPGDNENPASAMIPIFDAVGEADIVLPYPENSAVRGPIRHGISKAYTRLFNVLFGLDVPYYNGTVVHRTDLVRSVEIETDSFAYQGEVLIKLLRRGASFVPVGIRIEPSVGRESKALRMKNVFGVGRALIGLLYETRIRERAG